MATYVAGAPSDAWIEEREDDPSGRGYYEETGDHDEDNECPVCHEDFCICPQE